MTLSEKIKRIRMDRGFSQYVMANKLRITQSTYCRIENNAEQYPLNTIIKISKILSVSIIDLIDFELKKM